MTVHTGSGIRRFMASVLLWLFATGVGNGEGKWLLLLTALLWLPTFRLRLRIGAEGLALFSFCLLYTVTLWMREDCLTSYYLLTYGLSPLAAYISGYLLPDGAALHRDASRYIWILLAGRFLHGTLNVLTCAVRFGSAVWRQRSVIDCWTGGAVAATLQGTFYTMALSCLFLAIVPPDPWQKRRLYRLALLAAALGTVGFSLMTATRTALLLLPLLLLLNLCYYTIYWLHRGEWRMIMTGWRRTVIFLLLLYLAYRGNVGGLRTAIEGTALFSRLSVESATAVADQNRIRQLLWIGGQVPAYPFGGMPASWGYAHNLWLDTARRTGWIPALSLLVFTIGVIRTLRRVLADPALPLWNRFLLFSVLTGSALQFWLEPILEGAPFYFAAVCLIAGLNRRCLAEKKRRPGTIGLQGRDGG